jgi:hypothetical protein
MKRSEYLLGVVGSQSLARAIQYKEAYSAIRYKEAYSTIIKRGLKNTKRGTLRYKRELKEASKL